MKRYLNEALLYAVLSLVGGVFYREFTKIHGFVKKNHSGGGTYALFHTRYDRSLAAPSSGKRIFLSPVRRQIGSWWFIMQV